MQDVRRTEVPELDEIPSGLDAVADRAMGRWYSRRVHSDRLWARAGTCEQIFQLEISDLRESVLKNRLRERQRELGRLGTRWPEGVDAALPLIAGAARRSLGITPYRTQLMGALALGSGTLVEMATGEGKTLTIALAAVSAGWSGRPVHVVTANDYLATRDAQNLRLFYEFCGLSVAAIEAGMSAQDRRRCYGADVVYCTGKELVADFLRDRILLGEQAYAPLRSITRLRGGRMQSVLRGIHTAFVDEADNQLIDEAVTPLIISRPEENSSIAEATQAAYRLAASLLPGEDYTLEERYKEVELSGEGRNKVTQWCLEQAGLLAASSWMGDLVVTALQARHFFEEGSQYVIDAGKLVIVDEFTGRQMPGRSWRLGLHQAVEAKEALEISTPAETLARLSFQRFYRLFRHLGGITGTAREAASEFWRVYRLPFIEVPRHRPNQRRDLAPRFFRTQEEKLEAIVAEVQDLRASGRPILVGTRSVSASERIAQMLRHRGVDCQVLNAARHADEAVVIAMAGREGRVTIATNMAGRGTDILIDRRVAQAGGLHVILSEPHESRRVDRQLMGRAGRQGDPGSTRLYATAEDEILQRFLAGWLRAHFGRSGRSLLNRRLLARAQQNAERKSRIRRLIVVQQDAEMSKRLMNRSLDRI